MPQHATASQVTDLHHAEMPYARSWIDRLTEQIDRFPGPSWLFYVVALLVFAIANNAVFWIDGSQAVGSFEFGRTGDVVFVLFFLALYHYLSRVAGQCFDLFQPVLKLPEADLQIVRYRLTTLPRWVGWLVLIGIVLAITDVQLEPLSFGLGQAKTLLPVIYQSAIFSVTLVTILALVIQLLRQLRLVINLHRQAAEVDLFHLAPFHAFARFTSRAAIALVLFVVFSSLSIVLGDGNGVPLGVIIGISALAIGIFVIPLLGMQNRLQDERAQLLDATNEAIKVTRGRIHSEVNADTYEKISGLNTAMSALIVERDLIADISTWPWDASTLRGFASTLVLPIVLWLVTRLLERFV